VTAVPRPSCRDGHGDLRGARPSSRSVDITALRDRPRNSTCRRPRRTRGRPEASRDRTRLFRGPVTKRADRVTMESSNPAVATVTPAGLITRRQVPGSAVISASVGSVSKHARGHRRRRITFVTDAPPGNVEARTGDVLRFHRFREDATGKTITGLTPTWSFSPGHGTIDGDGALWATSPGELHRTASGSDHAASNRPSRSPSAMCVARLSLVGRLPRSRFTTEEVWLHPDGKHAYLGSGGGATCSTRSTSAILPIR